MNNLGKTIEAKVINHKGDEYTLEDFDKNTYHIKSNERNYDVGDTVKIFNYPVDNEIVSTFRMPL